MSSGEACRVLLLAPLGKSSGAVRSALDSARGLCPRSRSSIRLVLIAFRSSGPSSWASGEGAAAYDELVKYLRDMTDVRHVECTAGGTSGCDVIELERENAQVFELAAELFGKLMKGYRLSEYDYVVFDVTSGARGIAVAMIVIYLLLSLAALRASRSQNNRGPRYVLAMNNMPAGQRGSAGGEPGPVIQMRDLGFTPWLLSRLGDAMGREGDQLLCIAEYLLSSNGPVKQGEMESDIYNNARTTVYFRANTFGGELLREMEALGLLRSQHRGKAKELVLTEDGRAVLEALLSVVSYLRPLPKGCQRTRA